MNIIEFLLARVAEDEGVAQSVLAEAEHAREPHKFSWRMDFGVNGSSVYFPNDDAPSPARVLAECKAKRDIMRSCSEDYRYAMASGDDTTELAVEVLHAVAAVYSDHPDYDPAWSIDETMAR